MTAPMKTSHAALSTRAPSGRMGGPVKNIVLPSAPFRTAPSRSSRASATASAIHGTGLKADVVVVVDDDDDETAIDVRAARVDDLGVLARGVFFLDFGVAFFFFAALFFVVDELPV